MVTAVTSQVAAHINLLPLCTQIARVMRCFNTCRLSRITRALTKYHDGCPKRWINSAERTVYTKQDQSWSVARAAYLLRWRWAVASGHHANACFPLLHATAGRLARKCSITLTCVAINMLARMVITIITSARNDNESRYAHGQVDLAMSAWMQDALAPHAYSKVVILWQCLNGEDQTIGQVPLKQSCRMIIVVRPHHHHLHQHC